MEFLPLSVETAPQQVPVYSWLCYSALLYFYYKTTPVVAFLTSHREESRSVEVFQFSITLKVMRLIHLCGPLKVITRLYSGNERGHFFHI